MTYDVDYFIKKFEAIPDERWCTVEFEKDGASCAYGHCGMRDYKPSTIEAAELFDLFLFNLGDIFVTRVNDGSEPRYSQPTPKQRILAALYDIKKLQTKKT